jgi:hypothetical protein
MEMRVSPSLWLVVCVGLGLPGCVPAEVPTESVESATQQTPSDKADNGTPKQPERREAEPRLEWQWREFTGPLERHIDMVAFSLDGKLIAAGAKDTICVWNLENGKLITRMTLPEDQLLHRLVFTADGKTLVSDCREDRFIRFWDVKTGKQTREIGHPAPERKSEGPDSRFKAFDPKGEFLVRDGIQTSTTPGYPPRGIVVVDLGIGKVSAEVKRPASSFEDMVGSVSFAPDGKTFALNTRENRLEILETASGKLVKEIQPANPKLSSGGTASVSFSPDGRFLIARESAGRGEIFDEYRYVIWGVSDGRRYWQRMHRGGWISADNRYVLSGAKTVLDLLTDQDVPIKNAPVEERSMAGMSHDGKLLAFVAPASEKPDPGTRGFQKLSVYVTPAPVLSPAGGLGGGDLSPAELESAWAGAVADNLFRREHSLKVLGMRPKQTMVLAETKLKPMPEAEGKRVTELVTKLDDDNADVRDAATADLHKVAHQFEPYLRMAQKAAKPGEVRNRLIRVVQKLMETKPPPELVAELRGIALLEQLRNAEARTLLEKLAGGFPSARITNEAAAALKRLDQPKP